MTYHRGMPTATTTSILRRDCTCPVWMTDDDFDGPEDYADACSSCPVHGSWVDS